MAGVAIVTGGTRGIGEAISVALQGAGLTVAANYAGNEERARAFSDRTGVRAFRWDVSDHDACQEGVRQVEAELGPVSVLVNNAGITRDTLLMRMKTEEWQAVIDLNLTGIFLCTRAVSKTMLKQRSGRIINITSVAGQMGNPGQANYSAAKAGVIGFTKTVARELASRGITVNAVAPGFIATDMTSGLEAEPILKMIPLGRYGQPEEIAGMVRFLAADPAAAYITGQVFNVDGGMVMA